MLAHDRARRHELRLLTAWRPAFPVLLALARFARPIRRIPGLGWLVGDPATMRQILCDPHHFTIIGEGVVGHLWAQVLGDWMYDMLDGAGHHALRAKARSLFTEERATALVSRAVGPRLRRCTNELVAGRTVDVADLARVVVGRIVADMLGLRIGIPEADLGESDSDAAYRSVFAAGDELAALAFGSTASRLPAHIIAPARAIVARMTGGVEAAWREAPGDTLLGHCREIGLSLRETQGLAKVMALANRFRWAITS